MVNYDPKAWPRVILSFAGTVMPGIIFRVILVVIMTLLIYVGDKIFQAWREIRLPALETIPHQIVGFTVGFLIVFRTSTSYDRFWEGRRLWGSIVNASRNLVREAATYIGPVEDLAKLVAAYALALKQHLRGNQDLSEIQPMVQEEVFQKISTTANPPSALAFFISSWIEKRHRQGTLTPQQLRILEGNVSTILECQGGCERILRTPIPFTYAVHIKQLLMLYLFTLPFVLVPRLGWVTIQAMFVIAWAFLGIEEAGVEIEDPFGDDPNDLPIEAMCATIARDTMALAKLPE